MSNYVNLLDIVYPVGSMYFSTSVISPSSIIGGTWEQIKGALIRANDDSAYVNGSYSGSKKITKYQMPEHQHAISFLNEYIINQIDSGTELFSGTISPNNSWGQNLTGNTAQTQIKFNNAATGGVAVEDGYICYIDAKKSTSTNWIIPLYAARLLVNANNGGGRTLFHTIIHATYGKELPNSFGVDVNE